MIRIITACNNIHTRTQIACEISEKISSKILSKVLSGILFRGDSSRLYPTQALATDVWGEEILTILLYNTPTTPTALDIASHLVGPYRKLEAANQYHTASEVAHLHTSSNKPTLQDIGSTVDSHNFRATFLYGTAMLIPTPLEDSCIAEVRSILLYK
jgi:hypothetical protein